MKCKQSKYSIPRQPAGDFFANLPGEIIKVEDDKSSTWREYYGRMNKNQETGHDKRADV